MGDVLSVQNSQSHSHGDAVIAAQGSALGGDKIALHHQVQTFLVHILGAVMLLLTHHVQVALEDDGGGILIAGSGLFDDDDVIVLVLVVLQTALLGEGHTVIADGLGVPGAVGNGAQIFKEAEYALGFQVG